MAQRGKAVVVGGTFPQPAQVESRVEGGGQERAEGEGESGPQSVGLAPGLS